jgi:hypothetical protein
MVERELTEEDIRTELEERGLTSDSEKPDEVKFDGVYGVDIQVEYTDNFVMASDDTEVLRDFGLRVLGFNDGSSTNICFGADREELNFEHVDLSVRVDEIVREKLEDEFSGDRYVDIENVSVYSDEVVVQFTGDTWLDVTDIEDMNELGFEAYNIRLNKDNNILKFKGDVSDLDIDGLEV